MALGLKSLAKEIFSASTCKNEDKKMRLTPLGQALIDSNADFVVASVNLDQRLAQNGERRTDENYARAFKRGDNAAVRLVRSFAEALPFLEEFEPELAAAVSEQLEDIGFRFVKSPASQDASDDDQGDEELMHSSPMSGSDKAAQSLAVNPR